MNTASMNTLPLFADADTEVDTLVETPLSTVFDTRADSPRAAPGGTGLPVAAAMGAFDASGFEIGWDFAHYRLTPPADHLHARHPVREGWDAGRAAFGLRTLKPARAVQRWLALRLQAWAHGLPFEGLLLTARYLAQLDTLQCPVTRELLTHEQAQATDAVVMSLDPEPGFRAGHLVLVSRRVVQARGSADLTRVRAVIEHLRQSSPVAHNSASLGGLSLAQWQRLEGLLSLSRAQAHERIATHPLRALPPNRLLLPNPAQALQVLLTQLLTGEAYAARMQAAAALLPSGEVKRAFNLFMSALLARRLEAGWAADGTRLRSVMEDAWQHPVIERRWEQLALRLKRSDCERIVRQAAQQGLFGGATRWWDEAGLHQAFGERAEAPSGVASSVPLNTPCSAQGGPAETAISRPSRHAGAGFPFPHRAAGEGARLSGARNLVCGNAHSVIA